MADFGTRWGGDKPLPYKRFRGDFVGAGFIPARKIFMRISVATARDNETFLKAISELVS